MSAQHFTNTVKLTGEVVVVTGASSGIGEAIAWQFAQQGCKVVATGRRKERLDDLKLAIEAAIPGSSVLPVQLDVTDPAAVAAFPGSLPEGFKEVDILVNNAGCALGKDSVESTDPFDIQQMVNTNVTGMMQMTTVFAKQMVARSKGHIITLGSISGHYTYPGGSVYCATKFAVDGYMRGVQSDLGKTPVRVSVVSPGFVETEFSLVRFKGDAEKAAAVYTDFVPLSAADCADSVLYCATRARHVQVSEVVIWPTNQDAGAPALHRVGEALGAN